ncbi:MAG TPA: hypothetical protein PLJ11_01625 [Methanomassiliicoccales archaeon]|nr:hypothetical protein [Methanomassiliicoccales archaeon]
MKIFIDTANIEQIREVSSWGILNGVHEPQPDSQGEEGPRHHRERDL